MIAKYLQARYLHGNTPLAVFPMEGRREHLVGATSRENAQVTEELVLAVLIEEDHRSPGEPVKTRRSIRFFPGVTGHENYFLDDGLRQTLAETQDRGSEKSFFGLEINKWYLCAGTLGRWDALSVTVEDVRAAVAHFDQTAPEKKPAGETPAAPTENQYVRLSENNDHEGEQWHFYIPVAGNAEALDELAGCITALREAGETDFILRRKKTYPESEVDRRCARPSATSYLAKHTKLVGKLNVQTLAHPTPEAQQEARACGASMLEHYMASVLYKGGIRRLMVADETSQEKL